MKLPLMPAWALAACLPLLTPSTGTAQGITHIVSDNRSTANSSVSDASGASEFGSRTSFQPAVLDDHVASFTHRMAWFGGVYADGGFVRTQAAELAYSVTFTVQDPHHWGYTLSLGSDLRGVLQALGGAPLFASATLNSLRLSVLPAFEAAPINLPALTTPELQAHSAGPIPEDETSANRSDRSTVGRWRGTRSFLLIIDSDPSGWQAFGFGTTPALSFMQFGMAPRATELLAGYYTGNGSPAIDDLGHFVTVRAVYDIAPVPEPATALLWTCGLAALWMRARKRPRTSTP
jgi:hypothetical protein